MEQLKHECGVAMIRLLKPLEYYEEKYGTWMYGLNKLYLLMEKQHNRGQEGAGLACVKLEANPGEEYMFRERALGSGAITEIFGTVQSNFKDLTKEQLHDAGYAKRVLPFAGEVYMGHLRYSTTGKSGLSYVHPFLRRNNWRAKNLALCGNFNLTNVDEIFARITAIGQHPRKYADTYIMLEQVGHRLDREVERLFNLAEAEGLTGMGITHYIEDHIDLANVLRTSSKEWDGGYVMCGLTGSGETFAVRDPWGIRPAFWYQDDEIAVLASERPVIQTALNVSADRIRELQPGQALLINKAGKLRTVQINKPREVKPCSFERIYFSRGSDMDIYKERKLLGEKLVSNILKAIDKDIDHTVFSFIPNTAEVAFYGMLQGLDDYLNEEKVRQIAALGHNPSHDELERILSRRIRSEKVAIKDIKLRTFIAEGNSRNDLAAHVYDITYGARHGQSGYHRRQHCARHYPEAEHHRHPRPPRSEEDSNCKLLTAGALSRLLRHRHGEDERVHSFQGCHRVAERTRDARCHRIRLPQVQRTGESAQRTDGELRKGDIRSLYRRRDFRQNGGTAHSERHESPSADCISAS